MNAAPDELPNRSRWREFIKAGRSQLVVALAVLLLATATVVQIRSTRANAGYASMRRADLVQLLDGLTAESRRLAQELATLQQTRDQLTSGAQADQVAREQAQKRLDSLGILAGSQQAQGRGISITISAPSGRLTPDILLDAVQELRDSGAEAIEVNDQVRVVAQSWFGRDGDELTIDGLPVGLPLTIDAIGEPHALEEGARFRGGLVSRIQAEKVGGSVTISRPEPVLVSSTRTMPDSKYAKPA